MLARKRFIYGPPPEDFDPLEIVMWIIIIVGFLWIAGLFVGGTT
jgi:hypothetical protein